MKNTPDQADLTPGQIIKSARESQKISINDAAQRLLLGKQILAAIEDNDYSRIPAVVYAEGYLKAYAKLLQISPDLLIQGFRNLNLYSNKEVQKENKSPDKDDAKIIDVLQDSRFSIAALGIFIILFLAGSGFFLFNFMGNGEVGKGSDSSSIESPKVIGDAGSDQSKQKDDQGVANVDIPLEISQSEGWAKRR